MNKAVKRLYEVASKKRKLILGLMSGTSLDGLDIALCEIKGAGAETELKLRAFKTVTYPDDISQKLKNITSVEAVSSKELTVLNTFLGDYFGELVLEALAEWNIKPGEADCIASHGQTIYHAPASVHQQKNMPNATLQMGDSDHIAGKTGILTISDFRQKHTAAGGEGAPMASLVDDLLFRDVTEKRLLLNIGGIANFTYLPPLNKGSEVITTDTGPGNTLINRAMQEYFDKPFDEDGKIAKLGSVHPDLLNELKSHPFFSASIPKSTGPEMFNMKWVGKVRGRTGAKNITGEDLTATLTQLSAKTIVDSIKKACDIQTTEIYMSGGGMHNKFLIRQMEGELGKEMFSFEKIGFNPDAKEAAYFAVLANEALSGEGFVVNNQKVNFGKISLRSK